MKNCWNKTLLIMFLVLNLLQENLYPSLWDQKNYLSINFNPKKHVLIPFKKGCYKLCSNIFIYSQKFGKTLLRAPNNLKLIKYWKLVFCFLMYLLKVPWIAVLHSFHSSFTIVQQPYTLLIFKIKCIIRKHSNIKTKTKTKLVY